jgi:plastocyanin
MPDLDQRIADGLRELANRALVDAEVWRAAERHLVRRRRRRHAIAGAAVTVALLAGGLVTAAVVRAGDSKVVPANPGGTTSPGANVSPLSAKGPITGAFTITALPSIKFAPSVRTVRTGIYAVTFVDGSAASHTLEFGDPATLWSPQRVSSRGEAKTSRIYFGQPGDYRFFCAVPGHRAAGEQGVIHVTGPPITLEQAVATAPRR